MRSGCALSQTAPAASTGIRTEEWQERCALGEIPSLSDGNILYARQYGLKEIDVDQPGCGVRRAAGRGRRKRLGVVDTERHRPSVGSIESSKKVIVADCLSPADWKQLLPSHEASPRIAFDVGVVGPRNGQPFAQLAMDVHAESQLALLQMGLGDGIMLLMATATQLPLDLSLPSIRLEHGGDVGQGKRKTSRPYSSRRPMHAVFRSSRARQSWSLRRRENQATVTRTVREAAKRFGVVVYRMAVVGNHVHILLLAPSRKELQSFLRMATGQIAQHVTRARRGAPIGRFWDSVVYTRLITWGREYTTVLRYVELNEMETMGLVPFQRRARRRAKTVGTSPFS